MSLDLITAFLHSRWWLVSGIEHAKSQMNKWDCEWAYMLNAVTAVKSVWVKQKSLKIDWLHYVHQQKTQHSILWFSCLIHDIVQCMCQHLVLKWLISLSLQVWTFKLLNWIHSEVGWEMRCSRKQIHNS